MDPQLKQRLVGAAVLVALAVLFIPSFLKTAPNPTVAAIPRDIASMPADEFPATMSVIEPLVVTEIDKGLDADPAALAAQIKPTAGKITDLAALPAIDPTSAPLPENEEPAMPVATEMLPHVVAEAAARDAHWTIQLGSFTSAGNANGLLAKLRKAGFEAFVTPLMQHNKPAYRVRVGRTDTRPEAERLHARLAQTLGYTGMIVRNESGSP